MISERATFSFTHRVGLPLPQSVVYSSLRSSAAHAAQTFSFDIVREYTAWPWPVHL
jgi:hypothetical protein